MFSMPFVSYAIYLFHKLEQDNVVEYQTTTTKILMFTPLLYIIMFTIYDGMGRGI